MKKIGRAENENSVKLTFKLIDQITSRSVIFLKSLSFIKGSSVKYSLL